MLRITDKPTILQEDTSLFDGFFTYNPRQDGYPASRAGRRFAITHQTPGTGITGQTSFLATTPTFLFRQAASSKKIILRSMTLSQAGVVAGGVIDFVIAVDTADRYASLGTQITPQNVNADDATVSGLTAFWFNPTASAAGGGTRYVDAFTAQAQLGLPTQRLFGDELIIGTTGSILVYTWAATTGPTFRVQFDYEEVPA